MINNKFLLFGLVLILITCLFSCNYYSENDAKKYLPGKYAFKFPSGEVSILIINSNFTFNNKIYSKDKKILYETEGKMEVNNNGITFSNWLSFPRSPDFEVLISNPRKVDFTSGYSWRKPKDNYWTEGVIIIISLEHNYVFEKIE